MNFLNSLDICNVNEFIFLSQNGNKGPLMQKIKDSDQGRLINPFNQSVI
jgi:hypothetical protein